MRPELAPALDVGGERGGLRLAATAGFGGEPARDARLLHRDGERLVERRVVLHVDDLVRELVEDEPRELDFAVLDERRQHGIVEVAQRRVRGDAGHVHVVARGLEARRFGARVGFREIAAIRDAAGDGKAPLPRGQRKLRRREHVPDRVRPPEVGVARVAAVVGETELARGERADFLGAQEPPLSASSGVVAITSVMGFARARRSVWPATPCQ